MSARTILTLGAAGLALALGACTEKTQTFNSSGTKLDAPAFQGPTSAFTTQGWKLGDKTSWEQGLKTRTVNGQNEYTRVP